MTVTEALALRRQWFGSGRPGDGDRSFQRRLGEGDPEALLQAQRVAHVLGSQPGPADGPVTGSLQEDDKLRELMKGTRAQAKSLLANPEFAKKWQAGDAEAVKQMDALLQPLGESHDYIGDSVR